LGVNIQKYGERGTGYRVWGREKKLQEFSEKLQEFFQKLQEFSLKLQEFSPKLQEFFQGV
jgi:uncharacterized coiled-coil DUF342 family protein